MAFSTSAKSRLTRHDLDRFTSKSLFDRIARAVCEAGCLPRKELYEAWEVARRVRRLFRGGRVVDVAGGHGLLAQIMLLLDDSSPDAYVVDPAPPSSASKLHASLAAVWPRLAGRVHWTAAPLDAFVFKEADLIVSSHACGSLTDFVLERALDVRARSRCCLAVTMRRHPTRARSRAGWIPRWPSTSPGGAAPDQRLPRPDADHSRDHYSQEPPPDRRASDFGVVTGATPSQVSFRPMKTNRRSFLRISSAAGAGAFASATTASSSSHRRRERSATAQRRTWPRTRATGATSRTRSRWIAR